MVNRAKRLTGLNPLAYMGVEPITPPQFVTQDFDPTPNDWQGFNLGAIWLNTITEDIWFLVSLENNQAKWVLIGTGGGDLTTLTGNDALVVNPDGAGNIDVITANTTVKFLNTPVASNNLVLDFGLTNLVLGSSAPNIVAGAAIQNVGIGQNVFANLTGGRQNVGIGFNALASLTTGDSNFGCGFDTLVALTTGDQNTALGSLVGISLSTGNANTLIGGGAAVLLTTGSFNIMMGFGAGNQLATGSRNILVGTQAGQPYTGAESDNIILGGTAGTVGDSHIIRIGVSGAGNYQQNKCFIAGIVGVTTDVNDAIPVLIDSAGQLGTTSSSLRYKENVEDMDDYSSCIMNLRPVLFNYKSDQTKKRHFGLIAEEVEKILPDIVVHNKENEAETIKYHELPILLLNELKRQQKIIKDLSERIMQLEDYN